MNDKIRQLALQAGQGEPFHIPPEFVEKFARLIVRECVKECQQEWYDLNNAPEVENESIRGAGIRVGQKNGVLKCISKIKKHFGVEE